MNTSVETQHPDHWLADRTRRFDSSGIRKMFALATQIRDPINLSIGQPDFPIPQSIKDDLCQAVNANQTGYTPTEGIRPLREKLEHLVEIQLGPNPNRKLMVVSGTSGGLTLAMLALVNPGDEVVYFDPFFVMYPAIIEMVGGVPVPVDTDAHFRLNVDNLRTALSSRTKMILVNSPSNPTGICFTEQEHQTIAEIAAEQGICLVSDEIYSRFVFDAPHVTPARFNPDTLVIDGLSKSYAMTGLRLGYAFGPTELIEAMAKLQQFTFVCAPAPVQWASIGAVDVDIQPEIDRYREKRNTLLAGLDKYYEISPPGGAFYCFPRLPGCSGDEFLRRAIDEKLLIIPGKNFSRHDTHFRISYAVDDRTLERGIEALVKLAKR